MSVCVCLQFFYKFIEVYSKTIFPSFSSFLMLLSFARGSPEFTIVLYTGGARKSALLVREQDKRLAFPRVSLLLLRQL